MLCAVHCALLPLFFGLLPVMGLEILADHALERAFVIFAILLASISLAHGLRRHGSYLPFLLLLPGIALLVTGLLIGSTHASSGHALAVSLGGALVALSHVMNLRLNHVHGPHCRH